MTEIRTIPARRHVGIAAVVAAAVILGSLGATAAPAAALPAGWHFFKSFTANGVNIRTGPGTGYAVIGSGFNGQHFCVDGYQSGWYHGRNQQTGKLGWVSNSYLSYSPPKVVIFQGMC